MNDLIAVDAWMHFVLTSDTPLNVCENKFKEFTLVQDFFIRDEIQNRIIPDLEKRGYEDSAEAYQKMLTLLDKIIAEKNSAIK